MIHKLFLAGGLLLSAAVFAQTHQKGHGAATASYEQLHRAAVVIDTHNDALSQVIMKGLSIEDNLKGKAHTDLERLRRGGVDVQVFSVFCDEQFGKDTAFKHANIQIDSLYAIAGRNPDRIAIVRNPAELDRAVKEGKLAALIGVEGGHMIEENLDYLDALYKRGARYLTLTWNNSLSWATSAATESARYYEATPRMGLTDFGRQVVRRMNSLGMIVDVSHVGEKTFWDVMETTTRPVIASHSCAHALCPVPRNLKDDQIKAIARNGGVIHLNFFSGFVDSTYDNRLRTFRQRHKAEVDSLKARAASSWEVDDQLARAHAKEAALLRPSLSLLLDHLDHIVRLVGVNHVGLGSDFDGITSAPRGLDDVASFPLITKALLERGYPEGDIKKILGENFLRVFRANTKR